ncbi:MAG: NAD-glutamate dehydrogenase [Caulobacteraceae bacterium]|nr:NAD-glutamate dehydrogenase [Caulobacter sp.]
MDDATLDPQPSGGLEARVVGALGPDGADPAALSFVRQAVADVDGDAAAVGPGLAEALAQTWRFAAERTPREPKIELVSAGGGVDVLRVVQADRPFLVDSLMGELAETGLDVRAMAHPVVQVRRDAQGRRTADGQPITESMIVVLLGDVGADRRAAVASQVAATFADARAAVDDHDAMHALMMRVTDELAAASVRVDPAQREEDLALLRWLSDDHFVFLGAREYDYPREADGSYAAEEPRCAPETSYGVLRDQARSVLRRASEPAVLTRDLGSWLETSDPLIVAKSNLRSRVHRRAYMDYIGVKRYDENGCATGEVRFVGLFTAEAYEEPARDIPLIRRKIEHVLERVGQAPSEHTLKRLRYILDTFPRDELFQIDEGALYDIATGVLHLYDRPRVRLFARTDPFDRFVAVQLYVPRDRYDSDVRERAGALLAKAWNGRVSAVYPRYGNDPLARVHYVLGVTPGDHPTPDVSALEAEVAEAVRTWRDRFEAAARARGGDHVGDLLARYGAGAFSLGYRDLNDADEALRDAGAIETLKGEGAVAVRAYRDGRCSSRQFRFKLYREGEHAVPLADVLPILEHMGLKALEEDGFAIHRTGAPAVWIHEFLLEDERGERLSFADVRRPFEDAFVAVWDGRAESDGFNRLVMELGVDWRQAALVRALARYRQQSGLDPSLATVQLALRDEPAIARALLDLFRIKFDPAAGGDAKARAPAAQALFEQIVELLQGVASLDADRALRRLALLVQALKRTNFYQRGEDGAPKPYISFKVASRELEDLPAPKPFREIFVASPVVEGVHLRFGPVARGGLRWSDRRDDFRTEVLGLVKAQQVKNAVIVPVGSKGGFFPKQLPRLGAADAVRAEGVRAYTTFLSGLLDITDNLGPNGEVVRPTEVVAWEGDDPYLVVAADKGTATFSDIANGLALARGFWLGDAFASGGSVGYDHKAMGITARGAWVAVQRHFREMGKDIQREPFTMTGVGDMSGDVFGNGALLSKEIRLLAAFDHRDIFLDPDPDPHASWGERKRLFDLPRSSWQDYDKARLSPGGGVFSRSLKSIPLSPQVQAALDVSDAALDPNALIRAILKAPAELLYLGGIGTYVRAPGQTDSEVGDKASDAVRVTSADLRVKVVGEGANLGLTQAARIAYARGGGRIDTDAIDNSAGVDTSDHEVNIKILLGRAISDGALPQDERVPLLASMTDEVAAKVLAHNYGQTLALSLLQREGVEGIDAQGRFMADLVAAGRLDRTVEGLPGPAALAELRAGGRGLTRPELAVLLAYGKLELKAELVAGDAPDDPYFAGVLQSYFPPELARFGEAMAAHRLRRDIIATVVTNRVVDWLGPTFASRLRAATGADAGALVRAFEAALTVFRTDEAWKAVDALDGKVDANLQLDLYAEIAAAMRAHIFWMTRRPADARRGVQAMIDAYAPAAQALAAAGDDDGMTAFEQEEARARTAELVTRGAPEALARQLAALRHGAVTVEAADLAREKGWPVEAAARLWHAVGDAFGLDRLRANAAGLKGGDAYERRAVRGLVVDLLEAQARLAARIADETGSAHPQTPEAVIEAVQRFAGPRREALDLARQAMADIEAAGGGWSFAKLSLADAALRRATA